MPTTPTKTAGTVLLAWQDVATATVVLSPTQDVSAKWAAAFAIKLARRSGSAFAAGWPNVRVEASSKSSGNSDWVPLFSVQIAVGASLASTTLNGAVSAGATSCVVTAATNITAGDTLYLGDTSSANWELVRVKSVSGTTVTFEEACTFAHANGAAVTDQAESYFPACDLAPYARVRAVADNAGGGQTVAVEVVMSTLDSF
jgi:hypothetical protein